MSSSYGIAFDGKGKWIFGNDSAMNLIIFGVDNSSSSHTNNCNKIFLILGEVPIFGTNRSFSSRKKNFNINFSKEKTKLCLSLHYNGDNSYLLVNGKKPLSLRPIMETPTFQLGFA